MKYPKPPLSFQKQAELLISRGLCSDLPALIEKLKTVSYYRLSGYWYPFKNADDSFKPDTTLDKVWKRYTFDRQLRLLVLDAVERVEVSVRTGLVYHHSHTYGPFGYTEGRNFPNLNKNEFMLLLGKMRDAVKKSNELFVVHFQQKYGDVHPDLPLWMLGELMSFGMMLTVFRGSDKTIKRQIAREYALAFGVLESWLYVLNSIRNICAHHGRLWNRVLGIKPYIPAKDAKWYHPVQITNDRLFGVLTLLKYMLNYTAPQSQWHERLGDLLKRYPDVPMLSMGFPENWQECPIWK